MAHTQLSTSTKVSVGIAAVALVGLGAYGFAFLLQDDSALRTSAPRSPQQIALDNCLNKCVDGSTACLANPRIKAEVCASQQTSCETACRVEAAGSGVSGSVTPPAPTMRVYEIQTVSLSPAWVNKAYSVMLEVKNVPAGAVAHWSIDAGRLPEGIKLGDQDGLLAGIPTESGSFSIRVKVDSPEGNGTKDFTLLVNPEDVTAPPAPTRTTIIPTTVPTTLVLPQGVLPIASVVISTDSTLPEGHTGKSYQAILQTSSLPFPNSPVIWSVDSGRFPEGVKLSGSGVLSGIPTEVGRYAVRVRADNGSSYGIKEMVYTVLADETIAPPVVPPPAPPVQGQQSITINPSALPETVVGQSYRVQLGYGLLPFPTSDFRWSVVEGRLPDGVKLGDRDGLLAGIPTEPGSFHIRVRLDNTVNARGEKEFDLVVRMTNQVVPPVPPVPPVEPPVTPGGPVVLPVSPDVLPVGMVGQSYNQRLQVLNTDRPMTWDLVAGALPRGLAFDKTTGILSGTPVEVGQVMLSFRASDTGVIATEKANAARQYVLTIEAGRPALMVSASSVFPNGVVGVGYQHQPLVVSGGSQPYVWRIESGRLPEGVTLNQVNGIVSGVPTEAGTFALRIRVGDAAQGSVSQDFSLRVTAPAAVVPVNPANPPVTQVVPFALVNITAMPNGTVGDNYTFRPMTVTGGRAPYEWSVPPAGRLPSGLSVDTNGVITGVPGAVGTYTFTLQAQDADQQRLYGLFTLTINPRAQYSAIYTADPQWPIRVNRVNDMGLRVHDLIKLVDDNDPNTQYDTTVYYVGADGRRHAFPNAKVYFTWFSDYSNVRVVYPRQLADIPLGANLTYRPGVRLVKFITDPRVYAVDTQRRLRWVTTEQVATDLYGSNWNQNVDDISDAFYMDYRFDAPAISSRSQFDPDTARRSVGYPSDVMP